MVRLMQEQDWEAAVALLAGRHGRETAAERLNTLAGRENVYVAEAEGTLTALVLAVPAALQERRGFVLADLCGAADESEKVRLVRFACADQAGRGAAFGAVPPSEAASFGLYAACGFERAFGLRRVTREIRRNLWSQAEFDTVLAKNLVALRQKYCPDSVQFTAAQFNVLLRELYSCGVTILENEKGYGLYFRQEDTLHFIELMAENDRAAETLLEAARGKEIIAEQAVITLGGAQQIFMSENAAPQGMILFSGEPFDVSGSMIGMLL